ncbi:hypothetical protein ACFYXM_28135 [Streptomyces sp. NPDC002476]|uniref:hypothetical protein n=1 Tax=Streptomyces sp. NPDC002476 TaxID=3364648 RepID=UPI0036C6F0A9
MLLVMPRGTPEPLRDRATAPVVERVRKRHQRAGDRDLELFPAPEDIFGVLVYLREREEVLERPVHRLEALKRRDKEEEQKLAEARAALQENNLDRLRLIRRLRELVDIQEVAVLEACYSSGLKGREMGVVLGIESRGGAALRLQRLRLAIKSKWELRTPRLAKVRAEQEAEETRRVTSGHARVRQAALNLLSVRSSFLDVEDLDEWWDDLAWHLDGNDETPSEQAGTVAHLYQVVRDIRTQAVLEEVSPAPDEVALRYLAEAEEAVRRA